MNVVSGLNEFQIDSDSIQGTDHIQGNGKLVKQTCDVIFNIIIPANTQRVPYVILVSTGSHTHVPPPPWLIGPDEMEEVLRVLQPILRPGTTRCKFNRFRMHSPSILTNCSLADFLSSAALQGYLKQRGYDSIEDVHLAFTDKDKVSRLILRERLLMFPYSGGLEGVIFEWKTYHTEPETVSFTELILN